MKWTIIFLITFCNNLFSSVAQKYEVRPDIWGRMIRVSLLFNTSLNRLKNFERVNFEEVFEEMENIQKSLEFQEDKKAYQLLIKSCQKKYQEELENFTKK